MPAFTQAFFTIRNKYISIFIYICSFLYHSDHAWCEITYDLLLEPTNLIIHV